MNITGDGLILLSNKNYFNNNTNITNTTSYQIEDSIVITVSSLFSFEGGTIETNNYNYNLIKGSLGINNNAYFYSSNKKYFNHMKIILNGNVSCIDCDITLTNSIIECKDNCNFDIINNNNNNTTSIKSSVTWLKYNEYRNQVLNEFNIIKYSLPNRINSIGKDNIYDIYYADENRIASNVNSNNSLPGIEMDTSIGYPLEVTVDSSTSQYYSYHIPYFNDAGQYNLYNRTIGLINLAECTSLCSSSYNWCKSFDYIRNQQLCLLSSFKLSEVGGLSYINNYHNDEIEEINEITKYSSHYELRDYDREIDSFLYLDGDLNIKDSSLFDSDLITFVKGNVILNDDSKYIINQNITFSSNSTVSFCNGNLEINNNNLIMNKNSFIKQDINSNCNRNNFLSFNNGLHYLYGDISGNISITTNGNSLVNFQEISTSYQISTWNFNIINILEQSTIKFLSKNDDFANFNLSKVYMNDLYIRSSGSLIMDFFQINVNNSIIIDINGLISSKGMGYKTGEGPGSGESHSIAASGGTHGGTGARGGIKVNNNWEVYRNLSQVSYGNSIFPITPGSGGGKCNIHGNSSRISIDSNGFGGGVVHIISNVLILEGAIDSSGMTGQQGNGGGSGGSIFIHASLISGNGTIISQGGNGDYTGSGGGGGGRVSIYSTDYSHTGVINTIGGITNQNKKKNDYSQSGNGIIFLSVKIPLYNINNHIKLFISSSQPLDNYLYNMQYGTKLNDNQIIHQDSSNYGKAYLMDNDNIENMNDFEIHVIGLTSLYMYNKNISINRIIGSSKTDCNFLPNVYFMNGVEFRNNSYSNINNNLSIENIKVHLIKSSRSEFANILISNKGELHLYNENSYINGVNTNSNSIIFNQFYFKYIKVLNGGRMYTQDSYIAITGEEFILDSGGGINVLGDKTSVYSNLVTFTNASITGATNDVNTALNIVSNCDMYGVITIKDNINFTTYNSVTLHNSIVTSSFEYDMKLNEYLTVSNWILPNTSHILVNNDVDLDGAHIRYGTSNINIPLAFQGGQISYINNTNYDSTLIISNGSSYTNDFSTIDVSNNNKLVITGNNKFKIHYNSLFLGDGKFYIENEFYPPFVIQSLPNIIVRKNGKFLFYNEQFLLNNSMYNYKITSLNLVDGGTIITKDLHVIFNITIDNLIIGNGNMNIFSNNIIEIKNLLSLTSGNLLGSGDNGGKLIIHSSASFEIMPINNNDCYVSELNVINYGNIIGVDYSLILNKAANIMNYGDIKLTNQIWENDDILSHYTADSFQFSFASKLNGHLYANLTLLECASKCENDMLITQFLPISTKQEKFLCKEFLYNNYTNICQLNSKVTSPKSDYKTSNKDVNSKLIWNYYVKNLNWLVSSSLYNLDTGKIQLSPPLASPLVDTTSKISISIYNDGNITIPINSTLIIDYNYINKDIISSGEITIDGSLEINNKYINNHRIDLLNRNFIKGNGLIRYNSDNNYIFNSIIATGVTLLVKGTLYVECNYSHIDIKVNKLVIDNGQIIINKQHPNSNSTNNITNLRIYSDNSIVLSNGGSIRSISNNWNHILPNSLSKNDYYSINQIEYHDVIIYTNELNVYDDSIIDVSNGLIDVTELNISSNALLSCSGRGYPDSISSINNYNIDGSSGGSYSGNGGTGYGSFLSNNLLDNQCNDHDLLNNHPETFIINEFSNNNYLLPGFAGGSNGDKIIYGGGVLNIKVKNKLNLDGRIECNGISDNNSRRSGGGSGGFVSVTTTVMDGAGLIASNGGNGGINSEIDSTNIQSYGGGGGGGKVLLYYNHSTFHGDVTTFGGSGYNYGSPGSIYKTINGTYSILSIFNPLNSISSDVEEKFVSIMNMNTDMNLDEFYIGGYSKVILTSSSSSNTLRINRYSGDDTGVLVFNNGTVTSCNGSNDCEFSLSRLSVYIGDNVIFQYDTIAMNNNANLYLSQYSSSHLSYIDNSTYIFNNISLNNNANIIFHYKDLNIRTSHYKIIKLQVLKEFYISENSQLHSNGNGNFGSYSDSNSKIKICNNIPLNESSLIGLGLYGSNGGGGGGYGGIGGDSPSITRTGGVSYGDIMNPFLLGSGGGGSSLYTIGGRGGGSIEVDVAKLILHGSIAANGAVGTGAGSGGGSGGSVNMKIGTISGTGEITANGGQGMFNAVSFGGGGSGGRISIDCIDCISTNTSSILSNEFTGKITSYGANSINDDSSSDESNQNKFYKFEKDKLININHLSHNTASNSNSLLNWLKRTTNKFSTNVASCGTIYMFNNYIHNNNVKVLNNISNIIIINNDIANVDFKYLSESNNEAVMLSQSFTFQYGNTDLNINEYLINHHINLIMGRNAVIKIKESKNLTVISMLSDSTSLLIIPEDSSLNLPSNFNMKFMNITVQGQLNGADNIIMSNNSHITLYPTAIWSNSDSNHFSKSVNSVVYSNSHIINDYNSPYDNNDNNTYTIKIFELSDIKIHDFSGIKFISDNIYSYHRSIIKCKNLQLIGTDSFITMSGNGYNGDISSNNPSNKYIANSKDFYGDGGWHCGRGGGWIDYDDKYIPYGNAFKPLSWGTAGAGVSSTTGSDERLKHDMIIGNSGGGSIRIIALDSMHIDGTISTNGDSCVDSGKSSSGGGAGGSIWLTIINDVLKGTGIITSIGGNGCSYGGGGGSGGRISIHSLMNASSFYKIENKNEFHGKYYVHSGDQLFKSNTLTSSVTSTSSHTKYSTMPSGGTIYLGDINGNYGLVIGTNNGKGGSDIYLIGNNPIFVNKNDHNSVNNKTIVLIDEIIMNDSNLKWNDKNSIILTNNIVNSDQLVNRDDIHNDIIYSNGGCLDIDYGSVLFILSNSSLDINKFDINIKNGDVYTFTSNTVISSNNILSIANHDGKIISINNNITAKYNFYVNDIYNIQSQTDFISYLDTIIDYFNGLNIDQFISFDSLYINDYGTLKFYNNNNNKLYSDMKDYKIINNSMIIIADNIFISQFGRINANSIVKGLNKNDFIYANNNNISVSSYGNSKIGVNPASGGGHSGFGTIGGKIRGINDFNKFIINNDNDNTFSSTTRGDFYFPIGAGGAGGAGKVNKNSVINKNEQDNEDDNYIYGGSGGGGLYFLIKNHMEVDGYIDVSGETPLIDSEAGGGAGGSILILCQNDTNSNDNAALLTDIDLFSWIELNNLRIVNFLNEGMCKLSGDGVINARGGHGAISTSSTIYGGAGSAGRVAIHVYNDSYTGKIDLRGGLTLISSSSISSSISPLSYEPYSNVINEIYNKTIKKEKKLIIASGATGSVVRRLTNNNINLIYYSWNDNDNYDIIQIPIPFEITQIDQFIIDSIIESLLKFDNTRIYKINDVYIHHTISVIDFDSNKDNIIFNEIDINYSGLLINGNGKISFSNDYKLKGIYSNKKNIESLLIISKDITMDMQQKDFLLSSITLILNGNLTNTGNIIIDYNSNMIITENSNIIDNNLINLQVNHDSSLFISSHLSDSCVEKFINILKFDTIEIFNDSMMYGPTVIIEADHIYIHNRSSIHSNGMSYIKDCLNSNGDGGGYGGLGGFSDISVYLQQHIDLHGKYNNTIDLNANIDPSIYGDYKYPIHHGSSGGGDDLMTCGTYGGGLVMLLIHEVIDIDKESMITSNGDDSYTNIGAGSGGSIWISISTNATLTGTGVISTNGGKILSNHSSGGYGGGGRIRIDCDLNNYHGNIYSNSFENSPNNDIELNNIKVFNYGTFYKSNSIISMFYNNITKDNQYLDVIDLVLIEKPIRIVQLISMYDNGIGSGNNSHIKGSWKMGYKSAGNSIDYLASQSLSSQATARDVYDALIKLSLRQISVSRQSNSKNGYDWLVTFFNYTEHISLIQVSSWRLYTMNNSNVNINVNYVNCSDIDDINREEVIDFIQAKYSFHELNNMFQFNINNFINPNSTANWINDYTLRIFPSNNNYKLYNIIGNLTLNNTFQILTTNGLLTSQHTPVLEQYHNDTTNITINNNIIDEFISFIPLLVNTTKTCK
jgi:hypothetical protein